MTNLEDERPTLAERYSRASTSSHLRAKADERGDVDYVIAAGWLRDDLATKMYRLRQEYDAMRAEMRSAESNAPSWEQRAMDCDRLGHMESLRHPPCMHRVKTYQYEAAALRAEGRSYLATARIMALINLKTLAPAKAEFWQFACGLLAPRGRFMLSDADAASLVGRVLDAWLDPLCHHCDGRGYNGGTHRGEPTVYCRPCRGSGNRRNWIGQSHEERCFATALVMQLDQQLRQVDRIMNRYLRLYPSSG